MISLILAGENTEPGRVGLTSLLAKCLCPEALRESSADQQHFSGTVTETENEAGICEAYCESS